VALTAPEDHERLAAILVDSAYRVHRQLGAGLLESVYETCLAYELTKRGLEVRRQVPVPIVYDGVLLDAALRIDLLVQDLLVVEVKATEALLPVHDAQLLTYLKLAAKRLGFLINFNVPVIKQGIRRRIL
jgi:GxxExxY protein